MSLMVRSTTMDWISWACFASCATVISRHQYFVRGGPWSSAKGVKSEMIFAQVPAVIIGSFALLDTFILLGRESGTWLATLERKEPGMHCLPSLPHGNRALRNHCALVTPNSPGPSASTGSLAGRVSTVKTGSLQACSTSTVALAALVHDPVTTCPRPPMNWVLKKAPVPELGLPVGADHLR